MLIENFEKEKFHAKQTEKADLKYPIEIYKHQGKTYSLFRKGWGG